MFCFFEDKNVEIISSLMLKDFESIGRKLYDISYDLVKKNVIVK
jgi:hypothetical protein